MKTTANPVGTPAEMQGLELAMRGGNYSPVTVTNHDTVGTAFLGVLALFLLVAFLRERARNRLAP